MNCSGCSEVEQVPGKLNGSIATDLLRSGIRLAAV